MGKRQLFVFTLTLAYYLLSLILLMLPLWWSEQQARIWDLYPHFISRDSFMQLLLLIAFLHLAILAGLILIAFRRLKAGLWLLTVAGGIWLALQFARAEGQALLRPVAELLLIGTCLLVNGKSQLAPPRKGTNFEDTDNEMYN
ncbi:MAG: hypothetical protein IPM52_12140 [Bacteroidetes bacterium]|nr:hypothetical protein [Bacteroidota bacterium]